MYLRRILEGYKKTPKYLLNIMLAILLTVPLIQKGQLLTISDYDFPTNISIEVLSRYASYWNDKINPGIDFSRGVMQFPYILFIYITSLGQTENLYISQILFFIILFFISITYLNKIQDILNIKLKILYVIFPVIYIYNPYSVSTFWGSISLTIIPYLLYPAIHYYFLLNITELINKEQFNKRTNIIYILYLSIINIGGNPIFSLVILGTNISIQLIYIVSKKTFLYKKLIIHWVSIISIYTMLNLYWLIGFIYSLKQESIGILNNNIGSEGNLYKLIDFLTHKATFLELIKLKGNWMLYSQHLGQPYFDYQLFFEKFDIALYILPLIVFYSLKDLLNNTKNKTVTYIALYMFLISIILIGGNNYYPLNLLFEKLSDSILFVALRNPIDKLGSIFVLSYLILFMLGINNLFQKGLRYKTTILTLLFIYILIILYPIYTRTIFRTNYLKVLPVYYTNIPAEYYKVENELITSSHSIFTLPYLEQYYGTKYKWEHSNYMGAHFLRYISDNPIVAGNNNLGIFLNKLAYYEDPRAYFYIKLLDIGYIMYHKDFDWKYHKENYKFSKQILDNSVKNLFSEQSNNKYENFNIYNFNTKDNVDRIYIAEEIENIKDYANKTTEVLGINNENTKKVLVSKNDLPINSYIYALEINQDTNTKKTLEDWNIGWAIPIVQSNTPIEYKLMRIKEALLEFKESSIEKKIDLHMWHLAKRVEENRYQNNHLIEEINAKSLQILKVLNNNKHLYTNIELINKIYRYALYSQTQLNTKVLNLEKLIAQTEEIISKTELNIECYSYCQNISEIQTGVYDMYISTETNNTNNIEIKTNTKEPYKLSKKESNIFFQSTIDIQEEDKHLYVQPAQVKLDFQHKENNIEIKANNIIKGNYNIALKMEKPDQEEFYIEIEASYNTNESSKNEEKIGRYYINKGEKIINLNIPIELLYDAKHLLIKIPNQNKDIKVRDITINSVNPVYVYLKKQLNKKDTYISKGKIEYYTKSPTKYEVKVQDISDNNGATYMVLNQSYNSNWKIKIPGDKALENKINLTHTSINGYANGWYIDFKEIPKDTKITIYYYPQRFILLGSIISIIVYGSCIIYVKKN